LTGTVWYSEVIPVRPVIPEVHHRRRIGSMRGITGPGRRAASLAGALLLAATVAGAPAAAQDEGGVVEVFTYWTAGGEAEGLAASELLFG
jgi:hypothetical protein